ncbi:radical SAM family heme chaperone HemW [Deferribacteraceae bacterium V6Fe1]|uniref:radical SAM family heme chaperone HemW n=1 Tax=Deferrivibrio essentukiensis TaxID=2880922 RepID=UPI001F60DA37|nr:radical SAM family heme chaperone HemW [Deferrivibrio essentukiensis]MCB4204570.1 radical SAM family heme chaperone HemW [Deferrivibrio essentukiensis]MDK2792472.1 oxygen-independent coproporphyrinogen oxidase [Deferribacteres bacterium]UOD33907.1 radical SAM family heme chaperone HemW [Deferribacteraceae bacterium V6Fe1]
MKGLYIHIPFCKSKCKYCGFFSQTDYSDSLVEKYLKKVIEYINIFEIKDFSTIYIGGGTPTSISWRLFDKFLLNLSKTVFWDKIAEFTIEANPESLTKEHLDVFKSYSVSRISMGVQSMDDEVLKFLGRVHTKSDVIRAVNLVNKILPNTALNIDIIFDIPKIEPAIIIDSLDTIIRINPEHISAYSYSFDTDFLPQHLEVEESQFLKIKEMLQENSYKKYEISNFAKEGFESIHNRLYWEMKEYLGIGAGASSMLIKGDKRVRFSFPKSVTEFLETPSLTDFEVIEEKVELLKEDLIFGLRLIEGVNLNVLNNRYGKLVEKIIKKCDKLFTENLLRYKGESVCLTEKGELYLDFVQQYLWEL